MSIYIGHIILEPIKNQKRYEQALYDILLYLNAHKEEVKVKYDWNYATEDTKIVQNCTNTLNSITFSLNDGNSVYVPFNVNYLKTWYFRIYHGNSLTDEVRTFGAIAWEVLNILKEHFPSKIHLFQERMDQWEPIYKPLTINEELRRQMSWIEARKDDQTILQYDELEDLWWIFESAFRAQNVKVQISCLETLLDPTYTSTKSWKIRNIDLVNKILEQESNKSLSKIQSLTQDLKVSMNAYLNQEKHLVTLGNQSDSSDTEISKEVDSINEESTYDKPISLRVCMFQLGESNNLDRITNVLSNLYSYSTDHLYKLTEKYDLHI